MKPQRVEAAKVFKPGNPKFPGDRKQWVADIRKALYASKMISYTQGYLLMHAAARQYGWNLNNGGLALMWRGGCIIRSAFLGDIKKAFDKNPNLDNLLLDPFFQKAIKGCTRSWRKVVSTAVRKGIPVPAFSTALAFFDGLRSERLPANLLQVQRELIRSPPARSPLRGFRLRRNSFRGYPRRSSLRRAHLRAGGQTARRIFPHQLDQFRGSFPRSPVAIVALRRKAVSRFIRLGRADRPGAPACRKPIRTPAWRAGS